LGCKRAPGKGESGDEEERSSEDLWWLSEGDSSVSVTSPVSSEEDASVFFSAGASAFPSLDETESEDKSDDEEEDDEEEEKVVPVQETETEGATLVLSSFLLFS
jgi:hypothetical protein